MRSGGLAALLLLAVLLAPAAQAAPMGELQARQVRTLDPSIATGLAKGLVATAAEDTRLAGHDLRIQASRLVAVANQMWSNVSVVTFTPDEDYATSQPREHRDAVLTTTRIGPAFDLTVLPGDAAVTLESLGGTALPSPDTLVESGRHVEAAGQPALWTNVQATVLWTPAGDVLVRVEGDFSMSLWDWDVRVNGTDYRSGNFRHSAAGVGDLAVYAQDYAAEQFLHVEDGVLEMRVPDGRIARAYMARLGLGTDGALALSGVEGSLPTRDGTLPLDGTIILEGGVDVTIQREQQVLSAEILSAEQLRADGATVPLATVPDTAPASPLPWLLGLLGVAPLVAAVWRSVHLSRVRRLTMLRMDAGRYELALHGSRPLLRSRRHRIFARTVRAVALLRLGRPAEARALLEERHWRGPLAASRFYLLAHAHALEGDREGAQRYLEAGLVLDRGLRADAATNPTLRHLLDRTPGFREGYT